MNCSCPICGNDKCEELSRGSLSFDYECPNCGTFKFWGNFHDELDYDKHKLRAFIFHHKDELKESFVVGEDPKNNKLKYISKDIVESWYPQTFSEKIDKTLLYLGKNSDHIGAFLSIKPSAIENLFFMKSYYSLEVVEMRKWQEEVVFYWDFLKSATGYLEEYSTFSPVCISFERLVREIGILQNVENFVIRLSPKGWERVYEIQKDQVNNKKVFVSMSFNGTGRIRTAIKKGIKGADFDDSFIDEIKHNHQIVPEMFRLIRESKYLVLEISHPNYGAYYEAGYALGQGKEVIVCCKESVFHKKYNTEEEKKYEKYLKPHFDLLQKQILVWKTTSDLTKKLSEWLKALDSQKSENNI